MLLVKLPEHCSRKNQESQEIINQLGFDGLGFPIDLKGGKTREFPFCGCQFISLAPISLSFEVIWESKENKAAEMQGTTEIIIRLLKEYCFAPHFKEFLGVKPPPKNLELKVA